MKYLALLMLFSFQPVFAEEIHTQIENCSVTSDPSCLKAILHRIAAMAAAGGGGVGISLINGYYTPKGTSYCPQQVTRTLEAGVPKLTVAYVSPCNASDTYECVGTMCSAANGSRTITQISSTSYTFFDQAVGSSDVFSTTVDSKQKK